MSRRKKKLNNKTEFKIYGLANFVNEKHNSYTKEDEFDLMLTLHVFHTAVQCILYDPKN